MKHAIRNFLPCLAVVSLLALAAAMPAMAQENATPAAQNAAAAAASSGTAVPASSSPNSNDATPAPTTTSSASNSAVSVVNTPITSSAADDPAVAAVMDRLKQDESRVSVGDMTAAQDTVARLDLMLQIEKKLGEIDKARQERTGASMMLPPGTSNLPVSMPAGSNAAMGLPSEALTQMQGSTTSDYSVARIAGRQGHYSATLMTPDGKQITVRQGDSLSNGLKVDSITSAGVKVTSKSGTKTLPLSGS